MCDVTDGNRHHQRLQTSQACCDQYRASRNEWQAQTIPGQSFPSNPFPHNTDQQGGLLLFVFRHEPFLQFFLSSASSLSSFTSGTGRKSQIRSFITTISSLIFKKRRLLSISSKYFCISWPSFTFLA